MRPDEDAERSRRLQALSELARQQGGMPAAAGPPAARAVAHPSRRGPVLAAMSLLALLAVVAAGVVLYMRRPATSQTPPLPALVTITLPPAMHCAQDAQWSPDGRYLAVFGQHSCPGGNLVVSGVDTTGTLLIYDAATARLLHTITLDGAVIPAAYPPAVQQDQSRLDSLQITYYALTWSPDSREVAIQFSAQLMQAQSDGTCCQDTQYGTGIVLVDSVHLGLRVIVIPADQQRRMQRQLTNDSNAASGPFLPDVVRWDLTTGTASLVRVPAALAYAWTPDGTLAASMPLPPAGTPLPTSSGGPVGNPDGGRSFAIWQDGAISLDFASCDFSPQAPPPEAVGYEYIDASGPVWSPNGRYLIQDVSSTVRLRHAIPASAQAGRGYACQTADPRFAAMAPVPPRDRALAAALDTLTTAVPQLQVAWNPAGTRLATALQELMPNDTSPIRVYDCSTGALVGQLDAAKLIYSSDSELVGQQLFVRWSPEGKRLLAIVAQGDAMLLWRPPA
jgi:WD40 repeat protein